jgi:hypothetical protein
MLKKCCSDIAHVDDPRSEWGTAKAARNNFPCCPKLPCRKQVEESSGESEVEREARETVGGPQMAKQEVEDVMGWFGC